MIFNTQKVAFSQHKVIKLQKNFPKAKTFQTLKTNNE